MHHYTGHEVIGAGLNCERIFKIKAVSGHRPQADPLLVSQGFIPFKKGQAFYVLAHYPSLDAYYVSNQYAVPFGRTALNGLVPAPLFTVVDLYSADSTKVPPPSPPNPLSPPLSPNRNEVFNISNAAVTAHSKDAQGAEVAFAVAVEVLLEGRKIGLITTEKTYQDFMRFHQAMLDHISADKARLVPALPQRPTLNMALLSNPKLMKENMDLLQQNLDSYLKQVIEYGFVDALSLFLLPPGMDTSSMTVSDYVPPPLSRSVESSRLSQQLMVASPDENSQDTFTTAPNTVDGSAPAAEPQYIAPASIRHHASTIPHPQRGSHNLRNSTTNQFSNIMDPNRTSLTNSDKHNSSTNDPRHSSLLSDTRASFQSMNPMDFRNSIGDLTQHQRDSLNSRHGSIISRASHRFSISSRRGSAMVSVLTMDLDTNVASSAKEVTDLPPKAPITQFGAGGPVKSSSVDEQDEDEDEEPTHEETEEEIKKRLHRNFVITGLASALEGMAINAHVGGGGGAGAALKPPTRVGSANTSRRGSDAGHPHPPPRISSRQVNMNGAADPKMLTQEANVINAYFEDEKKPASSTRDLGGLSGRSSSLGWRG